MAKQIKMLAPHVLAGRTLYEHTGPAKTLNLGGGMTITINPGDYTTMDACMGSKWLKDNPQLWQLVF